MRNTKKSGVLRFMIYPSGKGKFTAVCFEIGLVREGDSPFKLYKRINILARKYLESAIKNNLSDGIFNQNLPSKYEKKWKEIMEAKNQEKWQKAFDAFIWQEGLKEAKRKVLISE